MQLLKVLSSLDLLSIHVCFDAAIFFGDNAHPGGMLGAELLRVSASRLEVMSIQITFYPQEDSWHTSPCFS